MQQAQNLFPITLKDHFIQCKKNGQSLLEAVTSYEVTEDQVNALSYSTESQSQSQEWFDHRELRMTSSIIHDVVQFYKCTKSRTKAKLKDALVDKILMNQVQVSPAVKRAMEYGLRNESKARSLYELKLSDHLHLAVQVPGMKINVQSPFLSASLDGIVNCACHNGTSVLEIKCPYFSTDRGIAQMIARGRYIVDIDGNINPEHRYYTQIQFQMAVTGYEKAVLAVYLKNRIQEPLFGEMARRKRKPMPRSPNPADQVWTLAIPRDYEFGEHLLKLGKQFLLDHVYPMYYEQL